MSEFDDKPKWYWAAGGTKPRANGETEITDAGDRFVVASGQRELWNRLRAEVSTTRQCAWNGFGPKSGKSAINDVSRRRADPFPPLERNANLKCVLVCKKIVDSMPQCV
ncbi:hypothetical protein AAFG07_30540 [Bradyrhizobium sp. B097]|uniref:hypothetical protein n=1 Tax=Bradyrhizobium sp. B097 TaxID=3140244 RepID=UPI003182D2FD